MKVVTVIGARPQFVKAAPVSRAFAAPGVGIEEVVVHTGQHYDPQMSAVFFEQLRLEIPKYNLEVGSGSHGEQTSEILRKTERVILDEQPDAVMVYGDTNSTLAGALAAAKLNVPVAHVEAGLRSFNRRMPEEINRVITDHVSRWLFAPTQTAVENLRREGIQDGVYHVGDVMFEAVLDHSELASASSRILETLNLQPKQYVLVTVHRAENTDDPKRLRGIVDALRRLGERETIIWPVHPRTRKALSGVNGSLRNVMLTEPAGYFDMLVLERNSRLVLTDSGGVQKEACWLQVPCVTLRDETEWVETVAAGWNQLAGADPDRILTAVRRAETLSQNGGRTGDQRGASALIATALTAFVQ
jgi:UDP-N-acetylglucosamine 2-epimerase